MGDVIKLGDGTRIDRASQKILLRLNTTGWTTGSTLREVAELSQNQQVFHRMEEHLIPAGFVEEKEREPAPVRGHHPPRRFRLTGWGATWLDEHEDEVARPASRAETQQMAFEALDEAASAKESVQNYRKKLHRMKQRVEALEDLEERVAEVEKKTRYQAGSIDGLRSRKADESDLELVEERVDEVAQHQQQSVNHLGGKLTEQGGEIETLREEIVELRKENQQLRSAVAEFREEMDQGVVERARDRWLGDGGSG